MPTSILTACKFCWKFDHNEVPATTLAGQYAGGDKDRPAKWVPVCDNHFKNWYEDPDDDAIYIEPKDRLPAFPLTSRA